jgi:hypothetical protein
MKIANDIGLSMTRLCDFFSTELLTPDVSKLLIVVLRCSKSIYVSKNVRCGLFVTVKAL